MRRRKLGCAMHKLCGLLDRMQDPDTEEKEDCYGQGEGFG